MKRFGVGLMVLMAVAVVSAQTTKYGVTVVSQKKVDFTKFKSYSWTTGQPAADKTVDARIVAAIDAQFATIGMTKVEPGPGDVLVGYGAVRRTDVNVNVQKPDPTGPQTQSAVGTVYLLVLDPKDRTRLLQLRLDKPIDANPAQAGPAIDQGIAELFTKYPVKPKK